MRRISEGRYLVNMRLNIARRQNFPRTQLVPESHAYRTLARPVSSNPLPGSSSLSLARSLARPFAFPTYFQLLDGQFPGDFRKAVRRQRLDILPDGRLASSFGTTAQKVVRLEVGALLEMSLYKAADLDTVSNGAECAEFHRFLCFRIFVLFQTVK